MKHAKQEVYFLVGVPDCSETGDEVVIARTDVTDNRPIVQAIHGYRDVRVVKGTYYPNEKQFNNYTGEKR